jgi:tetratricopeptide (TPR) repeat protein
MPELRLVVAALNSTMVESHKEDSHYGWLGEKQLRWFAERLKSFQQRKWFRLCVVHHNVERGPTEDEENLRDADDLKRILGKHINLVLHGHTHKDAGGWLDNNVPIISTGSAALRKEARPEDVGNQYQILRIGRDRFERWTRRYEPEDKRWIGDTRPSDNGDSWKFSKSASFSDVEATFSLKLSGKQSGDGADEENRIVQIERPIDAGSARERLKTFPRFRLKEENHHRGVRFDEQSKFAGVLSRQSSVWLISDWGSGKEGFLGCALYMVGGNSSFSDVFRLQCGSVKSCDDLLAEAETQFGASFQEFSAAVAAIPATLVFDDLPPAIILGNEREAFERKIRPLFDFCPKLRLIFIARQEPAATDPTEIVKLRPLDIIEVREYLSRHTRARAGLDGEYDLERIHSWSGGLPMHLDRLLERMQFLSLSAILDEDAVSAPVNSGEPVPESLKITVGKLSNATTKHSHHSFRLLKVLTVLRDGETFQSIRRFYIEPFYQSHIEELVELVLIEDVPISQTAADLALHAPSSTVHSDPPKLLRIPRQVRDHVNSLMTDEEREEIIQTSTGLFFGARWWQGKIKLRTTLSDAYGQSALAGPGNEHVVARYLLARALERRNKQKIQRYAKLALSYCHKLQAADRFRDSLTASAGIMDLLRDTELDDSFVDAAHIHGHALRMAGHPEKAVEIFEAALERGAKVIIKENRATMYLEIAMSYEDLGKKDEALAAAGTVLSLAHPDSNDAYQGQNVIANLTLKGRTRIARLVELEQAARNKGHVAAANNVAIQLARETNDLEDALRFLEKVIISARDNYNRTRAVIDKVSVTRKHNPNAPLTDRDRRLLHAAYSYSYGQRIGNLLDKCHHVLWSIFAQQQLWSALLRLFRYSSFVWRLRGNEHHDTKYLGDFNGMNLEDVKRKEGQTLQMEILYFERRRQGKGC